MQQFVVELVFRENMLSVITQHLMKPIHIIHKAWFPKKSARTVYKVITFTKNEVFLLVTERASQMLKLEHDAVLYCN